MAASMSSMCIAKRVATPPAYPAICPEGYEPDTGDEPRFDAAVHLALAAPKDVRELNGNLHSGHDVLTGESTVEHFGFTSKFQILSEEGNRVMRKIVDKYKSHQYVNKSTERTPLCLRGLGYVSPFVRDLVHSEELREFVSKLAGVELMASSLGMNDAQVNLGFPGGENATDVDKWHYDSVDFVTPIILSDTTGIRGGEMNIMLPFAKPMLQKVESAGKGQAVLVQGSRIVHRVAAVKEAPEPRMSCVISWVHRDVFAPDTNVFSTFRNWDNQHAPEVEMARHKAWRIKGQMEYLLEELRFQADASQTASEIMRHSANELLQASAELCSEVPDTQTWFATEQEAVDAAKRLYAEVYGALPVLKSSL